MSKSDQALDIQEQISKKIDKLNRLGYEFLYYNNITSIRRKSKERK